MPLPQSRTLAAKDLLTLTRHSRLSGETSGDTLVPQARYGRVFGRRNTQHTIIIASGDRIRHFSFRPWQAGAVVACACLFFVGYMAATAYLFMRDDLIGSAHAAQARMTREYEERIASLRAQVDRVKSRQLVDQQNIEDSISRLYHRQMVLSLRHGELAPLVARARSAGLLSGDVPVPQARPAAGASPALSAIEAVTGTRTTGSIPARPSLASAFLPDDAGTPDAAGSTENSGDPVKAKSIVRKISHSLSRIETDQANQVKSLTARALKTASTIRTVLAGTGLTVGDAAASGGVAKPPHDGKAAKPGIGGPFFRVDDPAGFHAALNRLNHALDRLEGVRSEAKKLPFGRPLAQDVVTSPFGSREDPFLERMAFHPGVDLRAPRGTPVHATGAGTVTHAGPDAGYGNMVEIDHGDGVSSRYGHLSQVLVKVGEKVATGDVVGKSGSTGRSTGPHLHYEVRLNGHPVNPERFLDSGLVLQALLHK